MSAPTCTDCGTRPAHPLSPPGYCRPCSEQAGHGYAFRASIDLDKLAERLQVSPLAAEAWCRGLTVQS
jgi:hypothetical protein